MLKKRTLALLLSLAMLLTFMPAMAFADDTADDGAEQPAAAEVEEAADEAVVEEAAEEEVQLEAEKASVDPVKAEISFNNDIWGYVGSKRLMDNDYRREGNSVKVTFSDNSVINYIFVSENDGDIWDFFPDGDSSKQQGDFYYEVAEGGLKQGTNKVTLQMYGDSGLCDIGTFDVQGIPDESIFSVEYKQASPLTTTLDEYGYADYYGDDDKMYEPFAGDTITVKCYELSYDDDVVSKKGPYTAVYECKEYTNPEIDYTSYEFVLTKADPEIEDWFNDPVLQGQFQELEFVEDVDQDKTPWKAGSTHKLTVKLNGIDAGTCTVNVTGNAAPHTHVAGEVKRVELTEATCTKGGTYVDVTYCSECGKEMSRSAVKKSKALGHSFQKIPAKPATCQETGVKAHLECTNCRGIFTTKKKATTVKKLTVKKKKHNFKKKILTEEYLKSAATCTKPAYYYYTCSMCGEKGKKTFKSGKALGHKFEQSLTKATPAKNGSIGQKCTVCGKKGKTKVIPKASKIAVVKKYKKKGVPESALAGGKFIEVKNSKGKKIATAEYEISFENDIEAGTGVATINFVGANYEGPKTVKYKIAK